MSKELLTLTQAAKYCAVNRVTLWKSVKSGDLKTSFTPGGHYRIIKKDLELFMQRKGIHPFGANYPPLEKRILIVDDDPDILELFNRTLSRHGYETKTAEDGFEAGVKATEFKPALIILDLLMPRMDGFEVCERIRKNRSTSHMKILAITGYPTEENKKKIIEAGADGFISKPVDTDIFIYHVESLLNHRKSEIKNEELKRDA